MFKTTTYDKALQEGKITQELLAYPAQEVFLDINGAQILKSCVTGGGAAPAGETPAK